MPAKAKKKRGQKSAQRSLDQSDSSDPPRWFTYGLLITVLVLLLLIAPLYLHWVLKRVSDADGYLHGASSRLRGSAHSLLERGIVDENGFLTPEYEAALEAAAMRHEAEQLKITGEVLSADRLAIVVVSHACVECLDRSLTALLTQADSKDVAVFVSLDAPDSFLPMEKVVKKKDPKGKRFKVWRKSQATPGSAALKIAGHFQFVLSKAFDENQFEHAIFLEDDLLLAPDFLYFFRSTAWLLREDPSLFCVSAWHDNGFQGMAMDEERLFRTSYFPGLGWMIRRETWDLIKAHWPKAPTTGWDHWMRHGSGLSPRECVVPEVSRTFHFNEKGTNVKSGTGIAKLLQRMALSKLPPGHLGNVSYLLQDLYEAELMASLSTEAVQLIGPDDLDNTEAGGTYVVPYTRESFTAVAKALQLYEGEPRAAHLGLIDTRHLVTGARIVLVDRRQGGDWLPEEEQIHPHPQLKVAGANPGESCDDFCVSQGMQCSEPDLEFVNNCNELKKAFPCESGCGHQAGKEIPCYVHDKTRDTSEQCLVTDTTVSLCSASHPSTTRLCACIPTSAEEDTIL